MTENKLTIELPDGILIDYDNSGLACTLEAAERLIERLKKAHDEMTKPPAGSRIVKCDAEWIYDKLGQAFKAETGMEWQSISQIKMKPITESISQESFFHADALLEVSHIEFEIESCGSDLRIVAGMPEDGQPYFYIDGNAEKSCEFWSSDDVDIARWSIGNVFLTEAECLRILDLRKALQREKDI